MGFLQKGDLIASYMYFSSHLFLSIWRQNFLAVFDSFSKSFLTGRVRRVAFYLEDTKGMSILFSFAISEYIPSFSQANSIISSFWQDTLLLDFQLADNLSINVLQLWQTCPKATLYPAKIKPLKIWILVLFQMQTPHNLRKEQGDHPVTRNRKRQWFTLQD